MPRVVSMLSPRLRVAELRRVKPPPKTSEPIYHTPEYQRWRARVISRAGGKCQDPACATPHRRPSRLFADHKKELRDMTEAEIASGLPFDPANGLARCGACHTRKTVDERAKRRGRGG